MVLFLGEGMWLRKKTQNDSSKKKTDEKSCNVESVLDLGVEKIGRLSKMR